MADKTFKIVMTDGGFNETLDFTHPKYYNAKIADAMSYVEELDRYDDFASLKIDGTSYEHSAASGKYGIKRGAVHRNSKSVILDHQQRAVEDFLRELRGFGLLADVVGSGKTFEACAVLSELAARGKINSMLLVVPDQTYAEWVEVLEVKFGLGEGKLRHISEPEFDDLEKEGSFLRPKRPTIVTMEDFSRWRASDIFLLLFDVIIVDEAHHLCESDGEYANAMSLLSLLMVTKRKANSPYCVLLSATPHSGNLEKMFRLWYFVRCKGGNPNDFQQVDEGNCSAEYQSEKEYYINSVCKGAPTVAEYLAVTKKELIEGVGDGKSEFIDAYLNFLKQKKTANYASLSESEKRLKRDEFLKTYPDIKTKVIARVAESYHNGVMRSIMIRQPSTISKRRKVENYYFYPMREVLPKNNQFQLDNGTSFTVDFAALHQENAINGTERLEEFIFKQHKDNWLNEGRYDADYFELFAHTLVTKILERLSFQKNPLFLKENSYQYYWEQFGRTHCLIENRAAEIVNRTVVVPNVENNPATAVFEKKLQLLKQLLENYKNERVIVFFDYEIAEKDTEHFAQWKRVYQSLKSDERFSRRLIYAAELKNTTRKDIIKEYDAKTDAILLVGDPLFTEGANLQSGKVAINFQVTPDPLAMDQRIGRIFRLGQTENVNIISMAAMNELEGYLLAYFNRIGLMHSSSGDATIIAGSSSDHMVVLKCPACNRVKLVSERVFAEEGKKQFCDESERCKERNARGTLMEEISDYTFRCNKCDSVLRRSDGEGGYQCVSRNNDQKQRLYTDGNNVYSCSKLCIMEHCRYFRKLGDKCAVMKRKRNDKSVLYIGEALKLCVECEYRYNGCPQKCYLDPEATMAEMVERCVKCENAECRPGPQVYRFDDKWTAECPDPHCDGKMRKAGMHTFATYIRKAYEFPHDEGGFFCSNLLNEAQRTAELKEILEKDSR